MDETTEQQSRLDRTLEWMGSSWRLWFFGFGIQIVLGVVLTLLFDPI